MTPITKSPEDTDKYILLPYINPIAILEPETVQRSFSL